MFGRKGYVEPVAFIAIITLLLIPIKGDNLWWKTAFNSGHTLIFIYLSFVFYDLLKVTLNSPRKWLVYCYVLLSGMLFAVLIELLQYFTGREMSWQDLYRDFCGLASGLALIIMYRCHEYKWHKLFKLSCVMASLFFLILGVGHLFQLSLHYVQRYNAFPVIAAFDKNWTVSFTGFNRAELLGPVDGEQGLNKIFSRVVFYPGRYSTLSIIEPEPDWSRESDLYFDVISHNKNDVGLVLRVHDKRHNQELEDRYNKKIMVHPGLNNYRFSVDSIRQGPLYRDLDMKNIAGVKLFAIGLNEKLQLDFGDIYLQ